MEKLFIKIKAFMKVSFHKAWEKARADTSMQRDNLSMNIKACLKTINMKAKVIYHTKMVTIAKANLKILYWMV